MTSSESMILIHIQIAIMGAAIVFGMWYIWRGVKALEARVNAMQDRGALVRDLGDASAEDSSADLDDAQSDDECVEDATSCITAEEFMRHVFGYHSQELGASGGPAPPSNVNAVVVEEHDAPCEVGEAGKVVGDAGSTNACANNDRESEADTASVGGPALSKSKLKKMNTESIKQMCGERGLSTEGAKSSLIEQLLAV